MIFSNKIYPRPVAGMILAGEKTQTRRLVKEGDIILYEGKRHVGTTRFKGEKAFVRHIKNQIGRNKWREGRDYAVQLGRGKGQLGKCDRCGALSYWIHKKENQFPEQVFVTQSNCLLCSWNPIRICITGICRECLLDISESDAKKEGFPSKLDFLNAFYTITKDKVWRKLDIEVDAELEKQKRKLSNPEVWVLEFGVKK